MSPQDWIVLSVCNPRSGHMAIGNQIHKSKVFASSLVSIENEEASSLGYLRSVLPQVRHAHEADCFLDEGRYTSGPRSCRRLRLLSDSLRGLGSSEGSHFVQAQY